MSTPSTLPGVPPSVLEVRENSTQGQRAWMTVWESLTKVLPSLKCSVFQIYPRARQRRENILNCEKSSLNTVKPTHDISLLARPSVVKDGESGTSLHWRQRFRLVAMPVFLAVFLENVHEVFSAGKASQGGQVSALPVTIYS